MNAPRSRSPLPASVLCARIEAASDGGKFRRALYKVENSAIAGANVWTAELRRATREAFDRLPGGKDKMDAIRIMINLTESMPPRELGPWCVMVLQALNAANEGGDADREAYAEHSLGVRTALSGCDDAASLVACHALLDGKQPFEAVVSWSATAQMRTLAGAAKRQANSADAAGVAPGVADLIKTLARGLTSGEEALEGIAHLDLPSRLDRLQPHVVAELLSGLGGLEDKDSSTFERAVCSLCQLVQTEFSKDEPLSAGLYASMLTPVLHRQPLNLAGPTLFAQLEHDPVGLQVVAAMRFSQEDADAIEKSFLDTVTESATSVVASRPGLTALATQEFVHIVRTAYEKAAMPSPLSHLLLHARLPLPRFRKALEASIWSSLASTPALAAGTDHPSANRTVALLANRKEREQAPGTDAIVAALLHAVPQRAAPLAILGRCDAPTFHALDQLFSAVSLPDDLQAATRLRRDLADRFDELTLPDCARLLRVALMLHRAAPSERVAARLAAVFFRDRVRFEAAVAGPGQVAPGQALIGLMNGPGDRGATGNGLAQQQDVVNALIAEANGRGDHRLATLLWATVEASAA